MVIPTSPRLTSQPGGIQAIEADLAGDPDGMDPEDHVAVARYVKAAESASAKLKAALGSSGRCADCQRKNREIEKLMAHIEKYSHAEWLMDSAAEKKADLTKDSSR